MSVPPAAHTDPIGRASRPGAGIPTERRPQWMRRHRKCRATRSRCPFPAPRQERCSRLARSMDRQRSGRGGRSDRPRPGRQRLASGEPRWRRVPGTWPRSTAGMRESAPVGPIGLCHVFPLSRSPCPAKATAVALRTTSTPWPRSKNSVFTRILGGVAATLEPGAKDSAAAAFRGRSSSSDPVRRIRDLPPLAHRRAHRDPLRLLDVRVRKEGLGIVRVVAVVACTRPGDGSGAGTRGTTDDEQSRTHRDEQTGKEALAIHHLPPKYLYVEIAHRGDATKAQC